MKQLLAGNWKMNGGVQDARRLIADTVNGLHDAPELLEKFDFLVCPPFLHIAAIRHALHGFPKIAFGAQDCSAMDNGAMTGEISARMLKDSACTHVILGHSERRANLGESSETVRLKAEQALRNDLIPIVCIGETEAERDAGQELDVAAAQLKTSLPARLESFHEVIIAYEPVWAIGTGRTPTAAEIDVMHEHIAAHFKSLHPGRKPVRVLYGGSLKPENAREILSIESVGGGLIGGASLKAESFLGIARNAS